MFEWVTDETRSFMSRGYLGQNETVEERCEQVASFVGNHYKSLDIERKILEYLGKGYYSLSSPVWSNLGKDTGLPISCNNVYVGDTIESILSKTAEIGMQTKYGAGTSAYLGDIRPRGSAITTGGFADGPVHFASLLECTTDVISQGSVRRGNCAIYLDVDHPDIYEFLDIREEGSLIQKLSLGVCISDGWMEAMVGGDADKRKLWARILKKRFESGYPYIFFTDTVNKGAPDVYKDKGMKIKSSNLCSEIALYSDEENSFVCNLMSMNLLKYDEWEDTDAVAMAVYLLDAVMEEYIEKTASLPFMKPVHDFSVRQRALGLGTLGYHSYLQSKMIPFESLEAKFANSKMHRTVRDQALQASKDIVLKLGKEEPELLRGYGRRNVTLMAIAPTTSSSFILGQVSPSIEPLVSNYFTKDLAKGKFTYKNPYLSSALQEHGKNDRGTWESILDNFGSVQHLAFLSDDEKSVFKTFEEISQLEVVQQASSRQRFIDQSQSLNLMIHPEESLKEVNRLLIEAWRLGVKTLYYQRSSSPVRKLLNNLNQCSSCEG
ncbi:MAG: ribonucleoside-diphosphate reductase subunit alpha [Candidatus Riesia sp.]|nr:ribonucleoside-diphosphate reductase subunit alpha [Candidatus Riesia sp.]